MAEDQQLPVPAHLPAACLTKIFSLLTASELARAACVSHDWCDVSRSDVLWKPLCEQAFLLEAPKTPKAEPCPSYSAAFSAWRTDPIGAAYEQFIPRVSKALQKMKKWLQVAAPAILDSLQPGVSEEELADAEKQLGEPLPLALRVVYRLVNGQDLQYDAAFDKSRGRQRFFHESCFHGLFGGYSVYTHVASTRMYPLTRMLRMTLFLRERGVLPGRGSILFGASFHLAKLLEVTLSDASIRVSTAMVDPDPFIFIRAAPEGPNRDGIVRWLEEYAERLSSGIYEVGPIIRERDNTAGVVLYPIKPPHMAVAITRGVKVEFTAILVPEQSRISHFQRYMFAYCVRFTLLEEDEQQELLDADVAAGKAAAVTGHPMRSCQLQSRHWFICDGSDTDEVQGEAVVGHYPLLTAGGEPFSYQSCTEQSNHVGWMEGKFTFFEGSLSTPLGEAFEVACPRLYMRVPDFIF